MRYAHADMAGTRKREDWRGNDREPREGRDVSRRGLSMDGDLAQKLDRIADLADRYDAAVVVDDSHATGVLKRRARDT